MSNIYYLLLFILSTGNIAFAQQTLNGSLEPNSSFLTSSYCSNIGPGTYNAGINNTAMTIASGSYTIVADSNCGGAKFDVACVGMYYNSGLADGNRLSLKLSSPLIPNRTYQFAVYIKASTTAFACGLNYGYMNDSVGNVDSTSLDTLIAPSSPTAWLRVVGSFTPDKNDQFIFLQARPGPGNTDGLTFIDSVRILNPATDVELLSQPAIYVSASPNPFTGITSLRIDDRAILPCNITVSDMLGRTVFQRTVYERKTTINLSDIPKGAYFLRLTDKNNNNCFIKLLSQ